MKPPVIVAVFAVFLMFYFMAGEAMSKMENARLRQEASLCQAERDELAKKQETSK